MKKLIPLFTALLLLLGAASACASFQRQDWRYHRTVAVRHPGLALVELDRHVLAHTKNDMSDLRLTDADGREIPCALTDARPEPRSYPLKMTDNLTYPDHLSVVLDLGQNGLLHNTVAVNIRSKNDYLLDTVLEGSSDGRQWGKIASGKLLRLAPQYEKTSINYTPSRSRYLRLTIVRNNSRPLAVLSAQVSLSPDNLTGGTSHDAAILTRKAKSSGGRSTVVVDLGVGSTFVSSVTIQAKDRSFSRPVQAYHSNSTDHWQSLASGRIDRYQLPAFKVNDTRLIIGQRVNRYMKLEFTDNDSPPLTIAGIQVQNEYPRLTADLTKGDYILWYGNPGAVQPKYDTAAYTPMVDFAALHTYKPGPAAINPAYHPTVKTRLETNRILLNSVVVLAALLLGFVMLRNYRSEE